MCRFSSLRSNTSRSILIVRNASPPATPPAIKELHQIGEPGNERSKISVAINADPIQNTGAHTDKQNLRTGRSIHAALSSAESRLAAGMALYLLMPLPSFFRIWDASSLLRVASRPIIAPIRIARKVCEFSRSAPDISARFMELVPVFCRTIERWHGGDGKSRAKRKRELERR